MIDLTSAAHLGKYSIDTFWWLSVSHLLHGNNSYFLLWDNLLKQQGPVWVEIIQKEVASWGFHYPKGKILSFYSYWKEGEGFILLNL